MDVFISWSGKRSQMVASALREWLPMVIQDVSPFYSPDDIEKGARWLPELNKCLEGSKFGIICVTPENMQAPWLLFEAGAISKALDASVVCPLLLDLDPAALSGPLAQFQAARLAKDEVRKLVGALNKRAEKPLQENRVDGQFEALWSILEQKLKDIGAQAPPVAAPARQMTDMVGEVLDIVRSLARPAGPPQEGFRDPTVVLLRPAAAKVDGLAVDVDAARRDLRELPPERGFTSSEHLGAILEDLRRMLADADKRIGMQSRQIYQQLAKPRLDPQQGGPAHRMPEPSDRPDRE